MSRCPLVAWCHSDRDSHPSGLPKAKRSDGHYTIDSLIQKTKAVSACVFESDYLCVRSKAAGVRFTSFDEARQIRVSAEFHPCYPIHLAIDPGVHTGAVWFQVRPGLDRQGHKINVFADYFAEGRSAETNTHEISDKTRALCGVGTRRLRVAMDPAGSARTAVGPTVRGEYERAGVLGRTGLESWPVGTNADGLQLVEALLESADGSVNLTIHPRCKRLITAFLCYGRARQSEHWMDYAEDPQYPHEDLIDPLAGGIQVEFSEGRTPTPALRTVHASNV